MTISSDPSPLVRHMIFEQAPKAPPGLNFGFSSFKFSIKQNFLVLNACDDALREV